MDKAEADAMLGRDIGRPQGKLPAWPTATVGDSRNSANATANRTKTGHHAGTTLVDAIRIWPTPRASTGGPDPNDRKTGKNLQHAVNWPTPDAMIAHRAGKEIDPENWERQKKEKAEQGINKQFHLNVAVNWPTPTAAEGGKIGNQTNKGQIGLSNHPSLSKPWPTPMARDYRDGDGSANVPSNGYLGRVVPRDPTSHRGLLNADWVEALMGFPIGWTDCGHSGTR